ncbi:MAG: pilus assembly protein [Deltaproteobacteria bacterium]|nr:pilus assembly protein [Deltaproteobacteria bacterium]
MKFYKILKKQLSSLIGNTRGQSMVEFAVALPTVVLLLWAGMYIGNVYLVKHKTLAAARYGTWNFARGEQTVAQAKNKIAEHFFDKKTSGLYVTSQKIPSDFSNVGGAFKTIIGKGLDIVNTVMTDEKANISSLKIQYEVSPKLGALDLSDMHAANYKIESSHYVTANGWDGCNSKVHDMFGMIWQTVKNIFRVFEHLIS